MIKSIALLASLALAAVAVFADDHKPAEIEEITVFGTYFNDYKIDSAKGAMRADVSLLETAQSVTVIPDTVINEQIGSTLGEVLVNDASISPGTKRWSREVFNLRGFTLSSSTGYLRDGHQHWSHYQQPVETLESFEVIKGPSSILYGQSGPGGLVNMVTKKPTAARQLDLAAYIADRGSRRFLLDAGGALTRARNLRYRGVLVKQDITAPRRYQNGQRHERDRSLGALVLDYDLSDNSLLRVHYDRTEDEAGLDSGAWLDSRGRVIGRDDQIRDMSWAFIDNTVENYGLRLELGLGADWDLTLSYNKQKHDRQRFESFPRGPADYRAGQTYSSRPFDRKDDWQFTTAYADLSGKFALAGTRHHLLLGVNYLDYYYGQLRTRAAPIAYTPGQPEFPRPAISYRSDTSLYQSEFDFYGVYIQDLITFNDQWQLALGGRYDKQNRTNADSESLVPKAGLLFHPNPDATLYISFSEGFEPARERTLNEPEDINNGMKLDPVTSRQIELGAKWQLVDERLLLSAALFDISKTGTSITENISHPVFQTRTTQSGEQRHKGFEIAAQGAVTDTLFVYASAMHLDALYEKDQRFQGKRPQDAPEWSASLWSRYEFTDRFSINAGIFYEGDRFADPANTIVKPGYARVDAGANYLLKVRGSDLNLRLYVQNLFDKDYLGGGSNRYVTVGDGTNVRIEARLAF